ncbi:dihydropyrimidinase [Caloramator quimbayensis]|uniref:Dihydropyrimidinase n=1 Tax=Caloramator quimbayensis TaxID=1147123 RepID=A0A1T4Y8U8_9CLOT|nr:dihydropyrimidinase [Caloramator quimbayensis]SKA97705.1 dihydropyrimidinase [Caloramator quimbayensis]
MRTLIKNGKIADERGIYEGDIYIEDGIIKKIGKDLKDDCENLVEAKGKLIIPGGVDVHTHFNLHAGNFIAEDDFYSGTVAAACGGTTTIVDHMGFGPKGCSLFHQARVYHEYAKDSVIDYGFHGVIQHIDDDILNELEIMIRDEGISSFKIYLTYDFKIEDGDVLRLMERLKGLGGILCIHCENDSIINYLKKEFINEGKREPIYHSKSRPDLCEAEAVGRIIDICDMAQNPNIYIVHLSTLKALERVKKVKQSGQNIFAETCPQYLLLSEDKYLNEDGIKYILSPPLRDKNNQQFLWEGIRQGLIDAVATDHCPFSLQYKNYGKDDFTKCPNGIGGVEERIPLMFSEGVMKGRISLSKFIEVCCTNPAKIFGLYPKKGTISIGSDGDLVIIDTEKETVLSKDMLHSRCDYTAYEGLKLKGYPVLTLSRGEVIVKDNEFIGERGRGQYLKRLGNLNKKGC